MSPSDAARACAVCVCACVPLLCARVCAAPPPLLPARLKAWSRVGPYRSSTSIGLGWPVRRGRLTRGRGVVQAGAVVERLVRVGRRHARAAADVSEALGQEPEAGAQAYRPVIRYTGPRCAARHGPARGILWAHDPVDA
jgi:hypothetical protein